MNKIEIQARLRKQIYSPTSSKNLRTNAFFLSQGYEWVKENIYLPTQCLRRYKICRRDELLMSSLYYILADIAFLIDGFSIANRWYRKHLALPYREKTDTNSIYEDIAITYEYMGRQEMAKKYYRKGKMDETPVFFPTKKSLEVLPLNDNLADFRPHIVLSKYSESKKKIFYESVTSAYGALQNPEVVMQRLKFFCKRWKTHIREKDIFFFPQCLFDNSVFWNFLIENQVNIAILSLTRDYGLSLKIFEFHSLFDITKIIASFHLSRISNNIINMRAIYKEFPEWEDAAYCQYFYKKNNRMPRWKEYMTIDQE